MNEEELLSLDGENVTVAVSSLGFQRNGFFPQMSINGRLEKKHMFIFMQEMFI